MPVNEGLLSPVHAAIVDPAGAENPLRTSFHYATYVK